MLNKKFVRKHSKYLTWFFFRHIRYRVVDFFYFTYKNKYKIIKTKGEWKNDIFLIFAFVKYFTFTLYTNRVHSRLKKGQGAKD